MTISTFRKTKNVRFGMWTMIGMLALLICIAASPVRAECESNDPCCSEDTSSLQYKKQEARKAYTTAAMVASQQAYRQMKVTDLFECINNLMLYFNTIKNLLSSILGPIAAAILALLGDIIKKVCDFIVTGINSLLASICLPVPNLGFSMSLPGLTANSCNGVSLLNFMRVGGAPTAFPSVFSFQGQSIPNMSLGAETYKTPLF